MFLSTNDACRNNLKAEIFILKFNSIQAPSDKPNRVLAISTTRFMKQCICWKKQFPFVPIQMILTKLSRDGFFVTFSASTVQRGRSFLIFVFWAFRHLFLSCTHLNRHSSSHSEAIEGTLVVEVHETRQSLYHHSNAHLHGYPIVAKGNRDSCLPIMRRSYSAFSYCNFSVIKGKSILWRPI